jgi:hypothetical protein
MHIDSKIVLEAPCVGTIDTAPPAAEIACKKPHVWARDRSDSLALTAATVAVLLLSSGVTLSALAHAFIG